MDSSGMFMEVHIAVRNLFGLQTTDDTMLIINDVEGRRGPRIRQRRHHRRRKPEHPETLLGKDVSCIEITRCTNQWQGTLL